jgi:hypothetical protein
MKTSQVEDLAGEVPGASPGLAMRQPKFNESACPLDNQVTQRYYPVMLPRVFARCGIFSLIISFLFSLNAFGSEADLKIPDLRTVTFNTQGGSVSGLTLLYLGLGVCILGIIFGWVQYGRTKAMDVHSSMREVSNLIWETCKTYLFQQGKFLMILWFLIAACIAYYFKILQGMPAGNVIMILLASILGILGSYGVAWFGIRINTVANSRTAFSSLKGNPLRTLNIPLQSGMSVGLLLVSVELFFMICILVFLPVELVGACFVGFAIGESLGASALRICGGIFTKIADIGADLMKIVFNLPEDDPKNPGVIADCTGDNAGDSVGPTADGFETYGVTGVALVVFSRSWGSPGAPAAKVPTLAEGIQQKAWFCGSPKQVVDGIRSVAEKYPGLDSFMIHWAEGLGPKEFKEQLRWFAKDVMPALKRA